MKRIVLTLILCICALSLWAVPAKRISFTIQQPDGTELTLTQCGDEHFHYFLTDDNVMVLRSADAFYYAHTQDGRLMPSEHLAHRSVDRSAEEQALVERLKSSTVLGHAVEQRVAARRTQQMRKSNTVPTQGDVHVPVLLLQYSDVKFSFSDAADIFDDQFNADNYKENGGYGSVREYFEDQSEGKFIPKFDIIGPVTLSQNMEYYGGNDEEGSDKRPREMVTEACKLANAQADFSKYDNDGDGYVDFLYVIYAGYGEASNVSKLANTIWPHAWYLESDLALDGVKISRYACSNELNGDEGTELCGIGTVCHEFSHCLGLPDFYPTNGSNGFGLQTWSLMHSGNYNNNSHTPCGYTAYEKEYLGWIEIEELDTATSVTLTPLSEGGKAYKIVNDANPNEFYVVENRQLTQWDEYIPAAGMLVIHVDYQESAWQGNTINNDVAHQRMTIIPADNNLNKSTLMGDTYPGTSGNTSLTGTSKPAAKVYRGEYMGKDITDIAMAGDIVTFSFMKGALPVPVLYDATDVTEDGFSIAWDKVPGIKEYEVKLDLLEENPYMLDEDFSRVKKGNSDIGNSLDTYTNQPGWTGQNVYGLDGALRIGSSSARGALVSPQIDTDSTSFTVLFSVRKSAATDQDAYMVMAVRDNEWGSKIFGYLMPVDDDEWMNYFVVLDTIGNQSQLYLDTRDNEKTPAKECTRMDLNYIYVLPGDRTEELLGSDDEEEEGSEGAQKIRYQQLKPSFINLESTKQLVQSPQKVSAVSEEKSATEKRYYVTTIHTMRTGEDSCRFENLDGGLYRVSLRSVRDSIYSRYSNAVDVEIVDTMLPQFDIEVTTEIDNDSVYFEVNDSTVSIFYTIDGTTPTAYSNRYEEPFNLSEKATVYYMLRKEGYRRSNYQGLYNWFDTDEATYRIVSTVNPRVSISGFMGGNDENTYSGHISIADTVTYDSITYTICGIDDKAFSNATQLRSIEVSSDALEVVGQELFHGCTSLNAVVWDVALPLTDDMFDETSYHNLLVYFDGDAAFSHSLVDGSRMTLIRNGETDSLKLMASYPFYAPLPFTAKYARYDRTFTQVTGIDGNPSGWETIALPFDVQKFTHSSKGPIAPFGTSAAHKFWLSQYGTNGFVPATQLQANVPYIIAMPNHTEYGDNSLSGNVVFESDNVTIHATDDLSAIKGTHFDILPSYDVIAPQTHVYALNVAAKYETYSTGSVFVPERYTTKPFSAYMVAAKHSQGAPMFRIQMQSEPEEVAYDFHVVSHEGSLYVTLPEERTITIYDLVGRKVCTIACVEGVNEISHLQEGFYMVERTKVYVKR